MVITVTVLRAGLVVNVTMTLTSVCGVPVLLVPLVKMLEDTAACGKTKGVNRCNGDEMMKEYKEQTTTLVFEICVEIRYYGNKPLGNEPIRRLCHIMILF